MNVEVDGILVAARELKEPLLDLRQLALAFEGAGLSDEQTRRKMLSVSDRAIRQMNDLMKLRRLEDGLFAMEPVVVRSVCDEVTKELAYLFRDSHRKLDIKYSSRPGLVVANRELLKSVVYHFLVSAVHYSEEELRSKLIVQNFRSKVRVVVRDFGPALPTDVWREMHGGLVERPNAIAMRPGTSGLGLFIASRFSRYMHADFGAIRHQDGTSFYVDLKKSQQASLF